MERKTIRKIVKALYVLVMPLLIISLDVLLAVDYIAETDRITWSTATIVIIAFLNLMCLSLFIFVNSSMSKTKILPIVTSKWAPIIGLGIGLNKYNKNSYEFIIILPGFYIEFNFGKVSNRIYN